MSTLTVYSRSQLWWTIDWLCTALPIVCGIPLCCHFTYFHFFNRKTVNHHMNHSSQKISKLLSTMRRDKTVWILSLLMLRLLWSRTHGCKEFKISKPCHVGIHWIALSNFSQMSTHVPGFQLFFQVFCIILYWPNYHEGYV